MTLRRAAEQDNELAPPHSKCGEICAGCTPRASAPSAAEQGVWSRDRHGEATHPPPKRAFAVVSQPEPSRDTVRRMRWQAFDYVWLPG